MNSTILKIESPFSILPNDHLILCNTTFTFEIKWNSVMLIMGYNDEVEMKMNEDEMLQNLNLKKKS